MRTFARLLPLILALTVSTPALATPPAYTVTDLGALPGQNYSNANAINSQGQVGGSFLTSSGYQRAYVWTPGMGMRDLGQIADGNSVVNGLSASGQAVGSAPSGNSISVYNSYTHQYDSYMTYYGFLTTPGGLITQTALIPPFGGNQSVCYAINGSGEIVGQTGISQPFGAYDGPEQAFSLLPGQSTGTILPSLGGTYSTAYAVNDSGLVVGAAALASATSNYPEHAALWQNGQVTDLGTLGGLTSAAYGINSGGQIVGVSDTLAQPGTYGPPHPFSWQNGQMADLGLPPGATSGTAKAINRSGQVVGTGFVTAGYPYDARRAFLWSDGKAYDLTTLLVGDTDWTLTDGTALNDSGQIVGNGSIAGKYHAFLLTPVPDGTPRVGTLSPNRARVGDGDLTVTITGTGFAPGAVVLWNGTSLVTTFVSAAHLAAQIPASDLSAPTLASVTVTNPALGAVAGQLRFAVQPLGLLNGFDAGPASILAGNHGYGSVRLSQPAGPGGYAVTLLSSSRLIGFAPGEAGNYPNPAPPVTPLTLIVPAGSTYAQFSLITAADPAGSSGLPVTLTAQDGAVTLTQAITLDSLLLSSLTFNPSSVISGSPTTGTLTLNGPAPPGGLTVTLSTYSGAPVGLPATVTVPAESSSVTFPVTTTAVAYSSAITIFANSNDGTHALQSIYTALTVRSGDVPATTADYLGKTGQNGWFTGPVTFTLTAKDTGAATVTGTYYSVDGGPQQTYIGPFAVSNDGFHTLIYHSVNTAGSVESAVTITFKIDATLPVTTVSLFGSILNLTATDAGSGVDSITYSLDGGPVQTYFNSIALVGSRHSVTFSSVDRAGNKEATRTQQLTVDTSAPTTTATQSAPTGKNGWSLGPVMVTLTSTDPDGAADVAATYYSIDGNPVQVYTVPFVVSGNLTHMVSFWSIDRAANSEATQSTTAFIDGLAPTLAFGLPIPARNAAGWNNTPVDIPFYASDNGGSGIATTTPNASPVHIATEGNGQQLTVTLTDVAGSISAFPTPNVSIDLTAPVTTGTAAGAQVTLTATDNLSGVKATYYTLDGGTNQTYTAPFSVFGVGTHAVVYWSVDTADNAEAAHSLTVSVAPPPVLLAQVRYWPRTSFPSRMVGGKFQGSLDGVTYTTLATITRPPASGRWSTAAISTSVAYKYLRYLAPANSYGNIAELEFDTGTGPAFTKMTGSYFGTRGSRQNRGNTFMKAFDGSGATYFDAPTGSGNFVGLTLGG